MKRYLGMAAWILIHRTYRALCERVRLPEHARLETPRRWDYRSATAQEAEVFGPHNVLYPSDGCWYRVGEPEDWGSYVVFVEHGFMDVRGVWLCKRDGRSRGSRGKYEPAEDPACN